MQIHWLAAGIFLASGALAAEDRAVQESDIIGSWFQSSLDDGEVFFAEIEYLESGRKCTVSQTLLRNGEREFSYFDSAWQLVDGHIELMVRKSSTPYVPIGDAITDRVETINDHTMINQMIEPFYGSEKEIFFRSPYKRKGAVCDWVDHLEMESRRQKHQLPEDVV